MSLPLCAGLLAGGCLGRRPCASGRGTTMRWSDMDRDESRIVCESYACTAHDRIEQGGGTTGCGKAVSNCLALEYLAGTE
jgi:hypothetical protein